ncbi:MAG: type II secretion system protein [Armatimonadia bacterium]
MQAKYFGRHNRIKRARRTGFTLVEVLVVLAILVILFGLLFAPMMAGIDMATSGRVHARMQDVARTAAEQIRRELANAIIVYPPPTYVLDNGTAITDYSQIVFVPPKMQDGQPVTPAQPQTWTDPATGQTEYLAIRYFVRPPNLSGSNQYNEDNPFVLMRQEGLYRLNSTTHRYEFGAVDSADGLFYVDLAFSENAITPREGYDIPATATIRLSDGRMTIGYLPPESDTEPVIYLHDGVKFQPARVMGEPLTPSENNSVFKARHGNWMGKPNNGSETLGATALSPTESELQPRLMVYRWNALDEAFTGIALDSASTARDNITLRWNSRTGTVQIGDWRTVHISVDASSAPAAGEFWPVTIEGDSYGATGNLTGTQTAPLYPLYPSAPVAANDPRMPIAYRIDAKYSDTTGAEAKIVPHSTRITVMPSGGRRTQYTRVETPNQADIGTFEYSEYFTGNDQLSAEVRFNQFNPPGPDILGGTTFDMYVSYYYRRNFQNAAPYRDDVVYADYSTGEIINITLIPQHYTELETLPGVAGGQVVPPDMPIGGVAVRTQAVVHNARH